MEELLSPWNERFGSVRPSGIDASSAARPTVAFWESPQARHALAICDGSPADFWAHLVDCLDRLEQLERV